MRRWRGQTLHDEHDERKPRLQSESQTLKSGLESDEPADALLRYGPGGPREVLDVFAGLCDFAEEGRRCDGGNSGASGGRIVDGKLRKA